MRVLQLIHRKQLRGAEVFASQLSSHLATSGHVVKLVSIYRSNYPGDLVYPVSCLEADRKSKWLDYSGWKQVARLCNEFEPDIIQANAGDTLVYAALSKMIFRWKSPIVYRNASMMSSYLSGYFSRMLYTQLFRHVSAVASVSSATANDLVSIFPFLKQKTSVLPVGINVEDFVVPGASANSAELNLLHIGGFSFEKNHEGLLRIFKTIVSYYPNAILHLVGDGPLKKSIEEKVEEMGLSARVVFHGSISKPFQKMSFANALLLPSIIEGTPAVIMEAFAANIPVIAYNVGAVSSLIQDDVTGYLVESNNEASFVEKVHKCLSQTNDSILGNAFDLVVKQYNNEQIANGFVAFYKKILAQH